MAFHAVVVFDLGFESFCNSSSSSRTVAELLTQPANALVPIRWGREGTVCQHKSSRSSHVS